MGMTSKLLFLALVSFCCCLAQSPPPVAVAASYTLPVITAAPGQLITLIVEGITDRGAELQFGDPLPPFIAPGGQDLPNSLAGITVSYLFRGPLVPILAVRPYYGGCSPNMFTI